MEQTRMSYEEEYPNNFEKIIKALKKEEQEIEVVRNGYLHILTRDEFGKWKLAFTVSSGTKLNRNAEPLGGGIEKDEVLKGTIGKDKILKVGLAREIAEEGGLPPFICHVDEEGKLYYHLEFFDREDVFVHEYEKIVQSGFGGTEKKLQSIEAITTIEVPVINKMIRSQVNLINHMDEHPKDNNLDTGYLEKSGMVLIDLEKYIDIIIEVTNNEELANEHYYFSAKRPHVLPNAENRFVPTNEFMKGLGEKKDIVVKPSDEEWYRFSRFYIKRLIGKAWFFLHFIENYGIKDHISPDLLEKLRNCVKVEKEKEEKNNNKN